MATSSPTVYSSTHVVLHSLIFPALVVIYTKWDPMLINCLVATTAVNLTFPTTIPNHQGLKQHFPKGFIVHGHRSSGQYSITSGRQCVATLFQCRETTDISCVVLSVGSPPTEDRSYHLPYHIPDVIVMGTVPSVAHDSALTHLTTSPRLEGPDQYD